jgi:hypothetical protein
MSKLYRVHRKQDAGNGQAEAINPEAIRAVAHSQLASLQVADAVAFSLLLPACYRHKGTLLGYGLKFWPGDFATLKRKTPSYLRSLRV